jgi:XTP/dITP diphosphohydrolase
MKISFITSNPFKVEQANKIFSSYGISISHIKESYDEAKEDNSDTIVRKGLKMLLSKYDMPIMIEDTSFFFDAYPDFPGACAKFVFDKIGYDGIFRLIDGKLRTGHFISTVGFIKPKGKPIIFSQKMNGTIAFEPKNLDKPNLPYSRIFIPEGFSRTMSELSDEEIYPVMHRTKAFEMLAKYLGEKK